MAMIDYGAMLRVDGKFINKNCDLFMEQSDTGYVAKDIIDTDGEVRDIDGNYFVYAGDKHFCVAFYKGVYKVISNGKVIYAAWSMPFNSETHFFDCLPDLKVSRLSTYFEEVPLESWGTWEDYVKENWIDATGKEKLSDLDGGAKAYKKFIRHAKKVAYVNKHGGTYKTRPYRFLAEWDYNGHHYEVIFGYGIDPDEEVWNDIKNGYGFRQDEINIINKWFTLETN